MDTGTGKVVDALPKGQADQAKAGQASPEGPGSAGQVKGTKAKKGKELASSEKDGRRARMVV